MTKPEANAALCRALGVEPKSFGWHSGTPDNAFVCSACGESDPEPRLPRAWGTCEKKPAYPNLTSADVLMAALRSGKHYYSLNPDHAEVCTFPGMGERRFQEAFGMSMGDALFRAACAAFGIELDA